MGVPGLFAWLRKRYPCIASNIHQRSDGTYVGLQGIDNLYIGINNDGHLSCEHELSNLVHGMLLQPAWTASLLHAATIAPDLTPCNFSVTLPI